MVHVGTLEGEKCKCTDTMNEQCKLVPFLRGRFNTQTSAKEKAEMCFLSKNFPDEINSIIGRDTEPMRHEH